VSQDQDDAADLEALGYKQELSRKMGAFGNFALSFSVISILTGGISLYKFGLSNGGPFEMTFGWPLVSLMTLAVAASLAELASAYPTAGALYHWAATLGGKGWGWFTAWMNLVGQVAVVAGVDYAFADFLRPMLGLPDGRGTTLALYAAVLASHGLLNHVGIGLVTLLNELSAWLHLAGAALLVGTLVVLAPHQPLEFLFQRHVQPADDGSVFPFAYAALIGLLQAQWTFTGYDASAHVAEETVGARHAAPRGIVSSVVVSGVAGWIMLLAITISIRDLPAAAGAENSFLYVLDTALGGTLAKVLGWTVVLAMWFCGLSSVTSNSRMLFAFARDGGPPGSPWLKRVSPRFKTPAWAVWTCCVIAFLLALEADAYSVIVSISTIGLYAAYGIPILLAFRARRRGAIVTGPWNLGRWAPAVNLVALVWIAIITVVFVLPPDQVAGYTFAGLLALLVIYWVAWARRRFRGPAAARASGSPPP
jgi:amino acid transporter